MHGLFLLVVVISILPVVAVGLIWLFMVLTTLCLALITWLRHWWLLRQQQKQQERDHTPTTTSWRSGIFQGRVGHVRFHPTRHSFSYPFYIFLVDLEEVDPLFFGSSSSSIGHDSLSSSRNKKLQQQQQQQLPFLWPLTNILSFRVMDHMKHDPILRSNNKNKNNTSNRITNAPQLANKIFELVEQHHHHHRQHDHDSSNNSSLSSTACSYSSATHRILLVTQLCYWGYCFNPVSFYYIQNKTTHQVDAMVAEVSNTPWGEMHHYVLSQPQQQQPKTFKEEKENAAKRGCVSIESNTKSFNMIDDHATTSTARNYKFHKTFHVSPFMEMNYLYDWTFQETMNDNGIITHLDVITSMKDLFHDQRLQFTARMQVQRHPSSTTTTSSFRSLVSFLLQYPMFCLIIQVWIHYQAFWLFVKGIPYIPHPAGSETIASRIIGTMMIPFFAIQDIWSKLIRSSSSSKRGYDGNPKKVA